MKIILDVDNYHLNKESKNEIAFVNETIQNLFQLHKDLRSFIDKQFKNLQPLYCEEEKNKCIYKLVKGSIKEIYDYIEKEPKDKTYYHTVYTLVKESLPYLLENESSISMDRFHLYEPNSIMILNMSNKMLDAVHKYIKYDESKYIEMSLVLMCNNAVRAIRSSLMMFVLGDDVHGKSLYRGIIELIARIVVLLKQQDDFEEFNTVNAWVQEIYKHNENEQEAIQIKEAFKTKYKINESQLESFMLYGWAKNKNGKRIRNATDMISLAFGDDAQLYKDLYHEASEFVHEDYVLTPYDYVKMRKESIGYLVSFLAVVYSVETELNIPLPKFIGDYFKDLLEESSK